MWDISAPLSVLSSTAQIAGKHVKADASDITLLETFNTHKRLVTCITEDPSTGAIFTSSADGSVKMYKSGIWQEWDSLQVVSLPGVKTSDCGIEPFFDRTYKPGLPSSIIVLPPDPFSPRDHLTLVVPTGQKIVLLHYVHSKGVLSSLPRAPLVMEGLDDDRYTHTMAEIKDARRRSIASARGDPDAEGPKKVSLRDIAEGRNRELMVLHTGGQAVFIDTVLGSVHKTVNPRPDRTLVRDSNARPSRELSMQEPDASADVFWRAQLSSGTASITTMTTMPRSGEMIIGWSTGHVQIYDLQTGLFRSNLEIQKSVFKPEAKVHEACAVTALKSFRPVEARFILRDEDKTRDDLSHVHERWKRQSLTRMASRLDPGRGIPINPELALETAAAQDQGIGLQPTSSVSSQLSKTIKILTLAKKWRRWARKPVIVAGYSSGLSVIWDTRYLKYPLIADTHERAVLNIEYYPVKNLLITAGEEGTVKIWTFSTSLTEKDIALSSAKGTRRLTLLNVLTNNSGSLSSMIFAPMTRYDVMEGLGARVFVGYSEGTVEAWDLSKCDLSVGWLKHKGPKGAMSRVVETAVRADESDRKNEDASARKMSLEELGRQGTFICLCA